MDSALDLCEFAMENMHGGEIFISDMGALNIYQLAKDFISFHSNPYPVNVIGTIPGEKLYEELFTDTEAVFAGTYGNYYVIIPESLMKSNTKEEWISEGWV